MKKNMFRNVVFLLVAAFIVAAAATRPGIDTFKDYIQDGESSAAPPVIEYLNGFVYSRFTVERFEVRMVPGTAAKGMAVAVPHPKEVYIGLFGHFFKMD